MPGEVLGRLWFARVDQVPFFSNSILVQLDFSAWDGKSKHEISKCIKMLLAPSNKEKILASQNSGTLLGGVRGVAATQATAFTPRMLLFWLPQDGLVSRN